MITKIAVMGAGIMGSEIAQACAAGGCEVVLFDSIPEALEKGIAHVGKICARRVDRGRMTQEEADAIVARVTPTGDDAALADCDLAIEAVPELMKIKKIVFERLAANMRDDAIIASNTSGLSITEMAGAVNRPERVVGLHFFNPASVMKLVEVVEGGATAPETMDAAVAFAESLGKSPVRVRECAGFLVNRILVRAMCEAYRTAAAEGADLAAADQAVVDGGPAPMGPFALGDMIGLDTMAHLQRDLEEAYDARYDDAGLLSQQVDAGRLGAKSGAGFFEGKAPEATVDAAATAVAQAFYAAARDEAQRCVDEGIAAEQDVDPAMRFGCGWSEGPLTAAGA
ncbi:MAG: 3-hydroxybutyryl-CoA dehydrogenase [Actinobacteria bacterium]|nr:3-hydroxybutyryl-CoA dehydrogenase [Thermoleophilia bacterium]MCB9012350.1 3-hydroxybutyryl-CoA dehydrogenase [Actinomycetota bacterium]